MDVGSVITYWQFVCIQSPLRKVRRIKDLAHKGYSEWRLAASHHEVISNHLTKPSLLQVIVNKLP